MSLKRDLWVSPISSRVSERKSKAGLGTFSVLAVGGRVEEERPWEISDSLASLVSLVLLVVDPLGWSELGGGGGGACLGSVVEPRGVMAVVEVLFVSAMEVVAATLLAVVAAIVDDSRPLQEAWLVSSSFVVMSPAVFAVVVVCVGVVDAVSIMVVGDRKSVV